MIKKIICTGPESTGKTTLAKALAEKLQTVWVPEYARTYLETLGRPYIEADLLQIAKGQWQLEQEYAQYAAPYLICDTSFLVLKIWSMVKYGRCHPFILEQLQLQKEALFVLCGTDVEWEFDPLREHPDRRDSLYVEYLRELPLNQLNFLAVEGSVIHRLEQVINSSFLKKKDL